MNIKSADVVIWRFKDTKTTLLTTVVKNREAIQKPKCIARNSPEKINRTTSPLTFLTTSLCSNFPAPFNKYTGRSIKLENAILKKAIDTGEMSASLAR